MQSKVERMTPGDYGTNINGSLSLNRTLCKLNLNHTLWNETLANICANLTVTSLGSTGRNKTTGFDQKRESQGSLIFRYFLIALIFVLIIIGNSLTIHVVRNNRNLTSIKNYYYGYYIMNLSISDLLVGLVCLPTTLLYYIMPGPWVMGLFLCKLFPTLQIMVVSASIWTLTVITFERFLAIVHPLKPRSTSRSVRFKVVAVWIWSFIIALPSFIAYKIGRDKQCQEIGIDHWYTIVLFLINYALPLSFIFVTYLRIIVELKTQSSTGSQREIANHKRFLKMTVILVVSFALCFLPSNVIFFIFGYANVKIDPLTISTMLQYFHVLIWFNSCLNPFIYGSVDKYFKKGFKKALGLGSSNDSQDKTNLSKMSTGKGDKHAHANNHKWLPPNAPKDRGKRKLEENRSVKFSEPHQLALSNNNPAVGYSRLNDVSPQAIPKLSDKGFVSFVLYQSKQGSNMNLAEGDAEENKELFVGLGSHKKTDNGGFRNSNAVFYDLSNKEELQREFQLAKETVI